MSNAIGRFTPVCVRALDGQHVGHGNLVAFDLNAGQRGLTMLCNYTYSGKNNVLVSVLEVVDFVSNVVHKNVTTQWRLSDGFDLEPQLINACDSSTDLVTHTC